MAKKWQFKNLDSRIVLKGGEEITPANITNERIEELIKGNPNYANFFVEVDVKDKADKASV